MISNDTKQQLVLDDIDPITYNDFEVRKRDGRTMSFQPSFIHVAIVKAFSAERQIAEDGSLSAGDQEEVVKATESVIRDVVSRAVRGEQLEIELIQDAVENQLMHHGHYAVARCYIVYREARKRSRALRGEADANGQDLLSITMPDGSKEALDAQKIRRTLLKACVGYEEICNWQEMAEEVINSVYNGIKVGEIEQAMMLAARSRLEKEPAYGFVAAKLLLHNLYKEVFGESVPPYEFDKTYREGFKSYIKRGVDCDTLSPQLLRFDLDALSAGLNPDRDNKFNYLGLQTVYDRYLLKDIDELIETPQFFFMRVAMGLSINEGEQKNERVFEFYNLLSTFRFMSSTPTLFNSGTCHPQLSSCYLLTIDDDLNHIFKTIADDAALSKWAGGLGNDWTNVRATGSRIKGTNGKSQGVIPFLKVANDTAVAVNQGGKRKGAMCAYLETWHLDIEDFLELRKNTGDERRRTHDMHLANWIPDLFMKRVKEHAGWTLFSPSDTPDLHDLVGKEFENRYLEYEKQVEDGTIALYKKVEAVALWRRMLSMLFETGHPWITWKDPSNIRSPQQHAGVVHSSNLCTEILLNTSNEESAVCNLGSVNVAQHMVDGKFNEEKVRDTVNTAIRMLDNVIDINFYPTVETRKSNLRHRPIGLGLMGFQDALIQQRIPYDSPEAVQFADTTMETISYYAILASSELAKERGTYESYEGSLWSKGILPIDSVELLEEERGGYLDVDRSMAKDWAPVRESLKKFGMRNSNTMAIAPTATISNITGVNQSIEPTYKQLYAKTNLSGSFTVVNPYLVEDLKELGMWDQDMIDDLKHFEGSIQEIDRIPDDLRNLYKCAFEVDAKWLIDSASRRQKWIDMGQSLNLYMANPDGPKLHEMYMWAWERGLKTTYYLRSLAATTVEKSTVDINSRGIQPRWMKNASASSDIKIKRSIEPDPPAGPKECSIDDDDCESCQ